MRTTIKIAPRAQTPPQKQMTPPRIAVRSLLDISGSVSVSVSEASEMSLTREAFKKLSSAGNYFHC